MGTKQKKVKPKKSAGARKKKQLSSVVRGGETAVKVCNSGLEVWLYDEASRKAIKSSGGMSFGEPGAGAKFAKICRQGLLVGYSLYQDDEVHLSVLVGKALTKKELGSGRWLEPQYAYLRLPSGTLCVESNDASRIGPDEPAEKGAVVTVPPGDYRLTLHRIDFEAIERDGVRWKGPSEVIVLTPGVTAKDAVEDLLPFNLNRDASWVNKYRVKGSKAEALVWFGDYWDTFILNLDKPAIAKLKIAAGTYLRTTVPDLNLTLISVYGSSWAEAMSFRPPSGMTIDEYSYAALSPMQEWDGAEALFCRRDKTKQGVTEEQKCVWHSATVEVLEAKPEHAPAKKTESSLLPSSERHYAPSELSKKIYFDDGFLALILSDLIEEAADRDELPLEEAVERTDDALNSFGLSPQGDFTCEASGMAGLTEQTCRIYTGVTEFFAMIRAAEGSFELVFVSELENGGWIVTGLADDLNGRVGRSARTGSIELQAVDDSIETIFASHMQRISRASLKSAPATLAQGIDAYDRLIKTVEERH